MTTRTSGRHARSRNPISSKAAASLSRWSRGIVSQSRAIIGPWLAAKAPTSLAMGAPPHCMSARRAHRAQLCYEFGLRHSTYLKIEAQEIGIDERRKTGDVIVKQRLANVRLDLVAVDDSRHVGAILAGEHRIMVQVKEQLAYPVVRHRRSSLETNNARQADPSA